jgi:hypothetical protein
MINIYIILCMRASFWLPNILEALILTFKSSIFKDSKMLEKYLHIDNNVHFEVCKVSIQNTMYSTLLKKIKKDKKMYE